MAGTGCRWNANEAGAGLLIFLCANARSSLRNAIPVDPCKCQRQDVAQTELSGRDVETHGRLRHTMSESDQKSLGCVMRQIKWLVMGVFIGLPMLSACANRTPAVTHERLPVVADTITHPLPPVTEQPKQVVAAPVEKTPVLPAPQVSVPEPQASIPEPQVSVPVPSPVSLPKPNPTQNSSPLPSPKPAPKNATISMPETMPAKTPETTALLTPAGSAPTKDIVAKAAKPAELPHASTTEPEPDIKMDLNALPITYFQWVVDYAVLPKSNHIQCSLRTKSLTMDDGEGGTPVYLSVGQNGVQAVTKSNIDMEYPGSGLQIDMNPRHNVDKVQKETIAVFEKDWPKLLEEIKSGQHATVTLGFWPTWPMTHTYSVTFDLDHFAAAWRALQTCQQQALEEKPVFLVNL